MAGQGSENALVTSGAAVLPQDREYFWGSKCGKKCFPWNDLEASMLLLLNDVVVLVLNYIMVS